MAVKNVVFRLQAETGRLRKELDEVKKSVEGIGGGTERVEKQFNGLTSTIKRVGAAIGAIAVGRQLLKFGQSAITAAADFEALEISFTTFLGSASEAKKVLQDLEDLSVSTPFTPEQVQNAGKSLLAFGIEVENLETSLRRIGDLSSGTGKDFNELAVIFGKAKVQGTLFAEDINQLTEAGIPVIQEFAKQLGVSEGQVKKLGSEGRINFSNLEQAFADLTGEGGKFFGLTESLSKSTSGRISTLVGNFGQLKREIGQGLLPVFESLLDVGFKVINGFKNFGLFFNNNRKTVALFTSALSVLVGALTRQQQVQIASRVQTILSTLAERRAAIATRFAAIQRLLAIKAIQGQTLAQRAGTVATIAASAATRTFSAVIRANPIGLLLTGLSLAASYFIDFETGAEGSAIATEELNQEVKKLSRTEQALNTVRDETNAKTAEQSAELKVLLNQLKNTNKGSKERSKLISEINSKYGLTLSNLKTEKKFVEQLDIAYQNYVNTLRKKIFFEAKSAELTRLITEQITLTEKFQDNIADIAAKNLFDNLPERTQAAAEQTLSKIKELSKLSTDELRAVFQEDPSIKTTGLTESFLNVYKGFDDAQKQQFDKSLLGANAFADQLFDVAFQQQQTGGPQLPKKGIGQRFAGQEIDILQEGFRKDAILDLLEIEDAILALEGDFADFDFGVIGGAGGVLPTDKIKSILLDLRRELIKAKLETDKNRISFADPVQVEEEIEKLKQAAEQDKKIVQNTIKNRVDKARKAGQLGTKEAKLFALIEAEQKLQIEEKLQEDISDIRTEAAKERLKTLADIEQVESKIALEPILEEEKDLQEKRKDLKIQLLKTSGSAEREELKNQLTQNQIEISDNLEKQFKNEVEAINKRRKFDLENEELTQEQRILINKEADLAILQARQDFNDKIYDFNKEQTKNETEEAKKRKDEITAGLKDVLSETRKLIEEIIKLRIAETDNQIEQQEKRVSKAEELAEKGNVAVLRAEEERLDKLQKQREKFVRAQQALAVIELVTNSVIAVSKAAAQGGAAAPFTIAATLIALAAGLVSAKAQAQAAAGSFAEGGYTGDGGKYQPAGTVHRGEFVFDSEKTRKFRPMFEQIHKGRNPFLTEGLNEQVVVVNNFGFDAKLERIESAIKSQDRLHVNIDENGISGIVSRSNFKSSRIRNKAR
jgi:tape measure domain-containing protein